MNKAWVMKNKTKCCQHCLTAISYSYPCKSRRVFKYVTKWQRPSVYLVEVLNLLIEVPFGFVQLREQRLPRSTIISRLTDQACYFTNHLEYTPGCLIQVSIMGMDMKRATAVHETKTKPNQNRYDETYDILYQRNPPVSFWLHYQLPKWQALALIC